MAADGASTPASPAALPTLGILAGSGDLPARLVAACRSRGRPFFILGFAGEADPALLRGVPHATVRLGAAADGIRYLREAGVRDLVFAGAVRRPSVLGLRPDWRTAAFFARVGYRALGDDGLLRAVIHELEGEGFHIVGADEVLGGDLARPKAHSAPLLPDAEAERDIRHGMTVAGLLGGLDIGQAVVVQQGLVLGVEAIEGTDALLGRCGALRREGPGGVLVKRAKPGQERRADLPAIGRRTVAAAAAAGLRGIAVEAGGTLVLDRPGVAAAADEAGLFVVGVVAPR